MKPRLLVFDSHPVQYRAPLWREIESIQPGAIHVVYASDCSVRGHADEGFGQVIRWDDPLLEGYSHSVLNCVRGKPLSGFGSLTGRGVSASFRTTEPSAVLLVGLNYRYDLAAYRAARQRGVPVWLRTETQDEAFGRPPWKSAARSLIYRVAYRGLHRAFYIGELNRRHLLRHGVPSAHLVPARYGTVDRFASMPASEKERVRREARAGSGIRDGSIVVGFSGKFIRKKNPDLLFSMLEHLPPAVRGNLALYFLGGGEMETRLRDLAEQARVSWGVHTHFAGFANQSQLAPHYLAMDLLVLPSRRMGETWGLVANEAMQAGCGVAVSDAVGCNADFSTWERFRVFGEEDGAGLARAVVSLGAYPRDFTWCAANLQQYSLEKSARAFLTTLAALPPARAS